MEHRDQLPEAGRHRLDLDRVQEDPQAAGHRVYITFQVERDGSLTNIKIAQRSGDALSGLAYPAGLLLIALAVGWRFLPETRGRSLDA